MIRITPFFYLILILFSIQTIVAQKSSIKGIILDSQNLQPIEYASIALLNPTDNSVIAGEIANKKGAFLISNILEGKYIIKIYCQWRTAYCLI